jgi:hypothetical protein
MGANNGVLSSLALIVEAPSLGEMVLGAMICLMQVRLKRRGNAVLKP